MLFLQLKPGEYLTIGEDIAIQVFHDTGSKIRVAVKAPREVSVLRGSCGSGPGRDAPKGCSPPQDRTVRPGDHSGFIRLTSRLKYNGRQSFGQSGQMARMKTP